MQRLVALLGVEGAVAAVEGRFSVREVERLKKQAILWSDPLRRLPPLPAPRVNPGFGRWAGQWPMPPGPWGECELIGGRGSGKSTGASNWTLDQAELHPGAVGAIVAPTKGDLWGTCIEHPQTGVLAWARPHFPIRVRPLKGGGHELFFPKNRTRIRLLTSERTEGLRTANNLSFAWVEELGACHDPRRLWDLLRLSVRVGSSQILLTTNPARGLKLINEIASRPSACVVQSSALDNPNLPRHFFEQQILPLIGTSRELEVIRGIQLDEDPNALFRLAWIGRISRAEISLLTFRRVGVGYDPAETSKKTADDTGIVAAGLLDSGGAIVLEDATAEAPPGMPKLTPGQNARRAVEVYWRWGASFITIDAVRNGETQRDLIHAAARELAKEWDRPEVATVNVILHGGNETKESIAIPVATQLYEAGLVRHLSPGLDALEEQLTTWTPLEGWSPDRLDATCAVLRELCLRKPLRYERQTPGSHSRRM